jgi:four helix bundle protein
MGVRIVWRLDAGQRRKGPSHPIEQRTLDGDPGRDRGNKGSGFPVPMVTSRTRQCPLRLDASSSKAFEKGERVGASFKELIVWQRAVQLTTEIYHLSASFPSSEKFGLINQIRRASVSVASNIAEGYGRSTKGEYVQFLGHARGSICELQTQLIIATALGFCPNNEIQNVERLSADVSRMLIALMNKLRK